MLLLIPCVALLPSCATAFVTFLNLKENYMICSHIHRLYILLDVTSF